ncbi:ATP-binding protein [Streptomyces bathyalis]|uniref:ATP-binding protein n=1 Tax=Streptomyces bathyalis TaxID=2710756 RepID=UPI0018D11BE2|nr:ATP-binding protein [Streptomyces bathyalis]
MSLPLTRRIAKTVLLTAAGAASVVGTAGAASAAELPTTADVSGLSLPDSGATSTLDNTTKGARTLTPMSSPVDTANGAAASGVKAAGSDTDRVAPQTREFAGDTADGAAKGLQQPANGQQQPAQQDQRLPAAQKPAADTAQPQQTLDRAVPVKGLLGSQKVLPNGLGTASVAGL